VAEYSLAPKAIRCLSFGETSIEFTLIGEVVIDVACTCPGIVEESESQ